MKPASNHRQVYFETTCSILPVFVAPPPSVTAVQLLGMRPMLRCLHPGQHGDAPGGFSLSCCGTCLSLWLGAGGRQVPPPPLDPPP